MSGVQGAIAAIEFIGALIIVASVVSAFWSLRKDHSKDRARALVAEGAVTGLGFKLAATLLKTIELRSWHQILIFAAVLALRTVLKLDFQMKGQEFSPCGESLALPRGMATFISNLVEF